MKVESYSLKQAQQIFPLKSNRVRSAAIKLGIIKKSGNGTISFSIEDLKKIDDFFKQSHPRGRRKLIPLDEQEIRDVRSMLNAST